MKPTRREFLVTAAAALATTTAAHNLKKGSDPFFKLSESEGVLFDAISDEAGAARTFDELRERAMRRE